MGDVMPLRYPAGVWPRNAGNEKERACGVFWDERLRSH